MAFFKKLKDRLFNSSSKIDEGLEAIVSDGGELESETDAQAAEQAAEAERIQAEQAQADAVDEARRAEEAAAAQQAEVAQAKAAAEAERVEAEEARAQSEREAEEQARRADEAATEAARQAEAAAAQAAHAQSRREQQAAEQVAQEAREAQDAAALQSRRVADAKAAQEQAAAEKAALDARVAAENAAAQQAAEDARRAAEAEAAEKAAQAVAEEQRRANELAEEEKRRVQDAAASARRAEEATAKSAQALPPVPILNEPTPEPEAKRGLLGRLMGRAAPKQVVRRVLDDDMLEQLEELLIAADMGVDTALRVTANMAEGRLGKKLSVAEIKDLMAAEIARILEPVAKPLPLYAQTPQVVLVVGVNGSGKTTTIGKLASQFRAAGKNVVIAAGDTFRAAAVEQLQVWGDRADVPVLTAAQGSDPASLAFDAMGRAEADGADLLLIDTAGRLQNRKDLMEELAKIVRVIRKKDPTAPHNTLLVLDATTGQNALSQVRVFQEISDVSGLVMTKLDGTAKGGVLVALADQFGLPIHAIGVGEQIDDLSPFDPDEFARALVGLEL